MMWCVRNDKIKLDEIKNLNPTHIILSLWTKDPKDSEFVCRALKSNFKYTYFGVCLGQCFDSLVFGGEIS